MGIKPATPGLWKLLLYQLSYARSGVRLGL
jgi:hypothetical protein